MSEIIREAIFNVDKELSKGQALFVESLKDEYPKISAVYTGGFYDGFKSRDPEIEQLGIELDSTIKMRDNFGATIDDLEQKIERLKFDLIAILGMTSFNENLSKEDLLCVISDIKEIGIKYRDNWKEPQ